jgi:hypothetical protein
VEREIRTVATHRATALCGIYEETYMLTLHNFFYGALAEPSIQQNYVNDVAKERL